MDPRLSCSGPCCHLDLCDSPLCPAASLGGGGAALFVLTLVFFSAGMAYLKRRADHQEAIASQQASYLAGMFQAATPDMARGRTITARELLDLGAQRIEHQSGTDPEVRAALLYNIGLSYRTLGYYSQALSLAREAYDIQARLYGTSSPRSVVPSGCSPPPTAMPKSTRTPSLCSSVSYKYGGPLRPRRAPRLRMLMPTSASACILRTRTQRPSRCCAPPWPSTGRAQARLDPRSAATWP